MMPDLTREERIKMLLQEALERTSDDRPAFLDSATADFSIRDEVLELIEAHQQAGDFLLDDANGELERVGCERAATTEQLGSMIGRYRLIEQIGEGGFGCVYLAEQTEPVTRRVALKIIKLGMDTQRVVARFKAERQALAMMDHPNIAHVLDAGATETGRPYFVMEFVEGVPITEYCERSDLDAAARLAIFVDVCRAVHHAHQKGIIHRDIKPSNILVTVEGGAAMPKVIDFGVAKAMQEPLAERTMFTEQGQFIGTPEYMSPEQAESRGTDIDTRSDIYSLGVLLYELLTDLPPFDVKQLRAAPFSELLRIIREENPPRPSTRLSKQRTQTVERRSASFEATRSGALPMRATEPQRLPMRIDSDLDWITLKAMEKDRDRRYSSAADLAEDICRHLRDEPVLARPAGAAYRLRKLYRRHRVPFIAATVATLALIGATIGTTASMLRARESAAQTVAVNEFMYDVLTRVESDARGVDVRLADVLDDASTAASQRFAGLPTQEGEVRLMLGDVYNKLDLMLQAADEFAIAAELFRNSVGPDDRRSLFAQVRQAHCLLNAAKYREAATALDGLLERIQRALGPDDELVLDAERFVIGVQLRRGEQAQAEQAVRILRQRALDLNASDALHIGILNTFILTLRGRIDSDRQQQMLVVSEIESLGQELVERATRSFGPTSLHALRAELLVADMMNQRGDAAGAAAICERVLAGSADRLSHCHSQRVLAMDVLADATYQLGDAEQAAALSLETIDCSRTFEDVIIFISKISDALPYLDRGGRWVEGEALALEYAEILKQFGGGHDSMQLNADLYRARFVSLQGRLDEADQLFAQLMQRTDEAWGNAATTARLHLFYGCHLVQRGKFEDAQREMQTAATALDDIRRGTKRVTPDDVLVGFIGLYQAWGKPEQAAEYQRLVDEMRP